MKTICTPGYHHNDFVATHALGHNGEGNDEEGKFVSENV